MTCGSFVSTVDRALRTIEWPSVKDVRVNLLANRPRSISLSWWPNFQPTEVASVRQVLTAVKGAREVRVSQALFQVSFHRAITNERRLLRSLKTQES